MRGSSVIVAVPICDVGLICCLSVGCVRMRGRYACNDGELFGVCALWAPKLLSLTLGVGRGWLEARLRDWSDGKIAEGLSQR